MSTKVWSKIGNFWQKINFGPKSKPLAKNLNFSPKSKFLTKNIHFGPQSKILTKHWNSGQKSKILTKKDSNFCPKLKILQKLKFWTKIENCDKKSKFWSKLENLELNFLTKLKSKSWVKSENLFQNQRNFLKTARSWMATFFWKFCKRFQNFWQIFFNSNVLKKKHR